MARIRVFDPASALERPETKLGGLTLYCRIEAAVLWFVACSYAMSLWTAGIPGFDAHAATREADNE